MIVFVSPHLDDVALSCPGRVLAEGGLVATLFTDGDDRAAYARRRQEDRAALALLGVAGEHLGLADAPSRRAHPAAVRPLLLEARERDAADTVEIARLLDELLARHRARRAYFPLAVGGHVDHRLVFDASLRLAFSGERLYYEDRPYSTVEGAVDARLRQLGASINDGAPGAYRRALAAAPYLRAHLPEGPDRDACLDALAAPRPAGPRLSLIATVEKLTAAPLARARAAASAYRSQLAELYGADEPVADYERLWAVRDPRPEPRDRSAHARVDPL